MKRLTLGISVKRLALGEKEKANLTFKEWVVGEMEATKRQVIKKCRTCCQMNSL